MGVETQFTNRLDPEPRRRLLFHFHKPETLAEWLDPEQNPPPLLPLENGKPAPRSLLPSTLRLRLRQSVGCRASARGLSNSWLTALGRIVLNDRVEKPLFCVRSFAKQGLLDATGGLGP
jgi:hypothetical protein